MTNNVVENFYTCDSDFITGIIYISKALTNDIILSNTVKTFRKFCDNKLSYSYLLSFCNKYKKIELNVELISKIKIFCDCLEKYKSLTKEELEEELLENLIFTNKNYLLIALLVDLIVYDTKFPFKTSFKLLFNGIKDFSFNFDVSNIYNNILLIPENKKNTDINSILSNNIETLISDAFDIHTIKDIENKSSQEVYLLFSNHILELDELLVKSSLDYDFDCHALSYDTNTINHTFETVDIYFYKDILLEKLDKRDFKVLFYRSKIFGIHSLESIGQKLSITRERVRQIEKKAMQKISNNLTKIKGNIALFISNIFDDIFIPQRILFDSFKDDFKLSIVLSAIIENDLLDDFRYNEEYDIIYIDGLLEEKITDSLNKLPLFVSVKDYVNFSYFDMKVISQNYKLSKDPLFIRKGLYQADIYSYIIEELFPNGFNASEQNVALFNKYIDEHFEGMEHCTGHAILASMERTGYILVDRGTYLHISKVKRINPILKDEIINYILSFNGTIYYATLFEKFKEKLIKIGIDNKYYFKGVLDIELPNEIVTKRDYLCSSEEFVSSKEILSQEIKKLDLVTLDNLRKKFPGVQDSVLMNAILSENMVLLDYGFKYISFEKLNLSNDFISIVSQEILNLLKISNTNFVTTHKLFARMKILHKDLMEKNKIVSSQFALFSILQYALSDKYFFRRPYISIDNIILEKDELMDNYLSTIDRFSVNSINSFISKTGLRFMDSFLDFFIDKSDEFVQITIDTAVKKNLLQIEDSVLQKIKKELDFYINSFGDIDTRKFNSYNFLPSLKYQWNKYLLVGIVRTYFNEFYDIEYTNIMYNLTDFIIRRY